MRFSLCPAVLLAVQTALVACHADNLSNVLAAASEQSVLPSYVASDLGGLGGTGAAAANDINDAGQVVGWSATGVVEGETHAVLWYNGTITDLSTLSGTSSVARGINSSGQIVGQSAGHGFLWENGVMKDLGSLDKSEPSSANDINSAGEVVGWGVTRGGTRQAAYLTTRKHFKNLKLKCSNENEGSSINSSGQIVGQCFETASGDIGYLWDKGKETDVGSLGGGRTSATAINDLGQVVGGSRRADGLVHAFIWESGTIRDLGTLGGGTSFARGINNQGQVVGTSQTGGLEGQEMHAFIWQDGSFIDLGTLGGNYSEAVAITSDGSKVVGISNDSDGQQRATLWTRQ